jgi:hypothetical protein
MTTKTLNVLLREFQIKLGEAIDAVPDADDRLAEVYVGVRSALIDGANEVGLILTRHEMAQRKRVNKTEETVI